ncbi:MAG: penicillin acylase family protein, partial [Bacteroidales bacterium]|nr:penicillin acylase family protein [Bacteroidales bacterium]
GVVLPGQPFIISGHNDSIAWGMTNVMLDDIDFYLETLNDDSSKYLLNGEWKDLIIKTENIKSKSGNSFEKIIKFTHRGPIISQFKDISSEAISMKWIGNEYSNELRSVYLLNRADNWDDFKEAMNTFNSTSQNIVYADLKNNIGLYCCAGIPIREGNGIFIAPGDTDKYDWQGLVPFNERPHAFNPETGYLISANNNTAQDYPYHISHWFHPPVRFDRIKELIDSIDKLSIEDHIMIQTDFKSNYAIRMNQEFLNSLKSVDDLSNKEKEVLSILEEWDGVYSVQSLSPTIFETLHMVFIRNIVLDEMGEELYKDFLKEKTFYWSAAINIFKNQNSSWYDNLNTPEKVENYRDILKTSYNETIEMLNKKYGKNIENWKWGKVHQLVLKHPMGTVKILDKLFNLNYGSFEVGGSYHTVAPYSFSFNNLFDVIHGASERHIYSLADWDESLTVIPTGNPGIPSSKYYCNQSELYVNNLYHSDYISRSKIENSYKYKIIFIP